MVLENWGGVSGIPGLGVSVRSRSSSESRSKKNSVAEDEWDLHLRNQEVSTPTPHHRQISKKQSLGQLLSSKASLFKKSPGKETERKKSDEGDRRKLVRIRSESHRNGIQLYPFDERRSLRNTTDLSRKYSLPPSKYYAPEMCSCCESRQHRPVVHSPSLRSNSVAGFFYAYDPRYPAPPGGGYVLMHHVPPPHPRGSYHRRPRRVEKAIVEEEREEDHRRRSRRKRDDDYSYAYDTAISPAEVIKSDSKTDENIYEEIKESSSSSSSEEEEERGSKPGSEESEKPLIHRNFSQETLDVAFTGKRKILTRKHILENGRKTDDISYFGCDSGFNSGVFDNNENEDYQHTRRSIKHRSSTKRELQRSENNERTRKNAELNVEPSKSEKQEDPSKKNVVAYSESNIVRLLKKFYNKKIL